MGLFVGALIEGTKDGELTGIFVGLFVGELVEGCDDGAIGAFVGSDVGNAFTLLQKSYSSVLSKVKHIVACIQYK